MEWDGLPTNPEACGWHWLNYLDNPLVAFWWPSDQTWELQMGDKLTLEQIVKEHKYTIACPWPSELWKYQTAMTEASDVIASMVTDYAASMVKQVMAERKAEAWRNLPTQIQSSLRAIHKDLNDALKSKEWDIESKARFEGGITILKELDKTIEYIVQTVGTFLDAVGKHDVDG